VWCSEGSGGGCGAGGAVHYMFVCVCVCVCVCVRACMRVKAEVEAEMVMGQTARAKVGRPEGWVSSADAKGGGRNGLLGPFAHRLSQGAPGRLQARITDSLATGGCKRHGFATLLPPPLLVLMVVLLLGRRVRHTAAGWSWCYIMALICCYQRIELLQATLSRQSCQASCCNRQATCVRLEDHSIV
jgi:hypothetical protein